MHRLQSALLLPITCGTDLVILAASTGITIVNIKVVPEIALDRRSSGEQLQ
jgi:hypothetical protein